MICFTFLLLFCIGTGQLVSSEESECSKYSTPVEKRVVVPLDDPSNIQGRAFESLIFRANNYGSSRYKLQASISDVFQLSIEMNNGPRPDSVKGGDLNGFYALYRSFITRRKIQNLNDKTGLEIWNIYIRKNNSAEVPSAHNVVSLNVDFEIGDRPSNQINLIISAMKKLTFEEPKTLLSYNYDLYEFLPLQTSFGIYETNKFPFAYPELGTSDKVLSVCGPIVQVYRFNSPLTISKRQFDEFVKYEQDLKNQFAPKVQDDHENEVEKSENDDSGESGKIFLTRTSEHMLFRRLVAESYVRNPDQWGDNTHAGGPITADKHQDDMDMDDDYDEDEDGEFGGGGGGHQHQEAKTLGPLDPNDPNSILAHQQPIMPKDEEYFPKDCVFLFKIHDDLQKRQRDRNEGKNGGAGPNFSMNLLITFTAVVTVMSACN